jgi:hypothetical protein
MAHSIEKDDKICDTKKITACRYTNRDPNKQEVDLFLYEAAQNLKSFQIFKTKIKIQKFKNLKRLMSLIRSDGTFNSIEVPSKTSSAGYFRA